MVLCSRRVTPYTCAATDAEEHLRPPPTLRQQDSPVYQMHQNCLSPRTLLPSTLLPLPSIQLQVHHNFPDPACRLLAPAAPALALQHLQCGLAPLFQ
jgi:hypothetical protein